MKKTLLMVAMLATATFVFAAAPASASHCSDVTEPYVDVGDDDDGDGKPDRLYICLGQDDVGRVGVNHGDYVSEWSGDRYTYAGVFANTDYNSPVGSNYLSTYANCQDEDNDMSGCDGYSVSLYANTYGSAGEYVSVYLYESRYDDDDTPELCIYSSLTDESTCEELGA